jgi:hypothetical protein
VQDLCGVKLNAILTTEAQRHEGKLAGFIRWTIARDAISNALEDQSCTMNRPNSSLSSSATPW